MYQNKTKYFDLSLFYYFIQKKFLIYNLNALKI